MATYNSGSYISTDNGKFRLEVVATVSNAGIVCTPRIHISNAFKKAQTFELIYYANNKTKKSKKTSKGGTKKFKSGTHNLVTFTIKSFSVSKPIKLKVNGKTATIKANTIKSTLKPPTPSMSVQRTKPTIWTITVTGKGEEEQPVNKVYLEYTNVRNAQDGDWSSLNYDDFGYHPSDANSKDYASVFKPEIEENQYYRFRARASGSKTGTEIFSSYVYSNEYVSRPDETSDVAVDTQTQVITWTAELTDIDKGIVKGWYIYRADGDGAFSNIAEVEAEEGQIYYSWEDTSQVTGHTYRYKVVAFNDYGESWDTDETIVEIEGVPYAPQLSDVHYYYDEDGSVVISVDLGDGVETTYIERSNDGGSTWTQIAALTAPLDNYTDTAATSDSIYRVRFGNDAGYSDYTDSFQPAATVEPSAPTILLPYHSNIPLSDGTVQIYWQHNPLDGSPQAAANLQISKSDGTVLVNENITGATTYYNWNVSSLSPSVIEIRIRTQGANGLWSEYSTSEFYLVRDPQIVINSPTGAQSTLPIAVNFTYTPSGVDTGAEFYNSFLEEVVVEIIDENGELAFKTSKQYHLSSTSPITDSISLMDALFESEQEYTLQISGRETNGLAAKHLSNFSVTYSDEVLDGSLYPIADNDEETGYMYVQISRDIGDDGQTEPADVVHAYLYRNANGDRVLLDEVYDGYEFIDKLAPVNKSFTYELLQIYEDGTAAIIRIEAYNPCSYSFIYWGKDYKNIAMAEWNPTQSTNMSRPERTLVRYSGRRYPVVYDSKARDESSTFSADLEEEQLDDFIDMMNAGGTGIWKSVQGRTYKASFDLDFTRVEATYNLELYKCTLKVSRVEE